MAPPSSRLPSAPGRVASERSRPTSMFEVSNDHMRRLQQIGSGRQSAADSILSGEDAAGASTKQSKRRSLLPQSFTRKFSSEGKEAALAAAAAASIQEDTSGSESGRQSEDRSAMPPPPKPRPTSMMRPPNSIARKEVPTHARLPSKEAISVPTRSGSVAKHAQAASSSSQSGIKRANSTRLPQSPGPRSGQQVTGTRSNAESADGGATVTAQKRSPTSTAQKRSSVILTKPPPLNTSLPPRAGTQPSPTSPTRPSTRSRMPAPAKPAFNTYQQHYSPAKSALPKPGIPSARTTTKAATSTEEAGTMTFDVAVEQIELLQLSLMHQASYATLRSYEASARQKLSKMQVKLQKEYQSIQNQEQRNRRAANLDALETWCPDHALLSEHLQTLSRVVSDLRAHTEPGSRYSELVQTFDEWATKAESFLTSKASSANFIEALPESWQSQHTSLALNMRSIQRDITTLPPLPPSDSATDPSSLHIMFDSCSSLADSMVRELELMTKLQKEVLQQGKMRIDQQISVLTSAGARNQDKENWTPAWQHVGS
ncbi:hypothetical protein Slin15195_G012870 [Septoria linicola]|uniref:Uncharacterized protein n=1 Tax=Septoria linicola TaxID=215465 RepID=A0A9Q9AKT4_9PEZI|nr:hypothetical protein Slin14017_G012900 [Septoria linicola]USW47968.1 hypothetical protein Slin15195_G012870 [Septoria linicola]